MTTVKLDDEIYKELHIIKKSEWMENQYTGNAVFDKSIKTAFLPGYGTTLFFENRHFIIINDNSPTERYAIWRNHKVIGHCDLTKYAAKKANDAANAELYFGLDKKPRQDM